MEDKVCLDTDVLVNFLRNKQTEKEYIENHENSVLFSTTFINLFELYYGAYKSKQAKNVLQVEELQHRLRILNLSKEAVRKAGETMAALEVRGQTIEFRDLLIGCTAQVEGFCLKTNNVKHFTRIPGLSVK